MPRTTARNLDQVMRALYTRYYRQNKGFLTADLLSELRTARMPDVDTFYRRYIDGRDSLPYEAVFAKAGIVFSSRCRHQSVCRRLRRPRRRAAGWRSRWSRREALAEGAGVQPGDVVTNVGGIPVTSDQDWGAGRFGLAIAARRGSP